MIDPTLSLPAPDGATAAFAGPPADAAALPDLPGYEVLGVLGRGGMSVVYKARQLQPSRLVAVKMLLRGAHAASEEQLRFLRDAQTIAALRHPNIVEVYEVGQVGGVPYFTLEFVPGGSLADRAKDEPMPPRAAAEVLEPVARVVAAAHESGFIHRDLKPANVLLTADGSPKVTDFGLAKEIALDSGLTQTGAIFGTPSYMAPEQAEGAHRVGPPADVWGLGATLYKLLTGRPPFLGATAVETCGLVMTADPVPPSRLVANLPRDLETICLKCLHKEPTKRYASAAAVADDLRRFLAGETILARPTGPAERAAKWVRRNPAVAALVTAVAVLLVVGIGVSTFFALRAADREEAARRSAEREGERAAEAKRAEERAKDELGRSLFEQARSLRQSRAPGRNWRAVELFREATALLTRDRPEGVTPADGLPTVVQLRGEAAAALTQSDVRLVHDWRMSGRVPKVSGDGRVALFDGYDASQGDKVQARVVDTTTGEVLNRIDLDAAGLNDWAIDHAGRRAAVAAVAGERAARWAVHVRELPSGRPLAALPWPKDPDRGLVLQAWATDAAFHGDHLAVAKLDEESLWLLVWDVAKPDRPVRTARFLNGNYDRRALSHAVGFSPDGRHVRVGLPDGKAVVVAADGTAEPTVVAPPGPVVGWVPGRPWWLALDGPEGGPFTPVAWDYVANKVAYRLPSVPAGALVVVRGDPPQVVVGTTAGTARLYDPDTGRELGETPALHPRELYEYRPLPDGRVCTVSHAASEVRVWQSVAFPSLQRVVPVPTGTDSVTPLPGRDELVATKSLPAALDDRQFSVLDAVGRVRAAWREKASPDAPVGLPGGRVLTIGGMKLFNDGPDGLPRGQPATVRDITTGAVVRTRYAVEYSGAVFGLAAWELAEHGGRVLYVGHHPHQLDRQAVVVWDLLQDDPVPKELARLTDPALLHENTWLTLTPDGRYLISSPMEGADRRARVWDVATGKAVGEIAYPPSSFLSFRTSGDGRWAVAWVGGTGDAPPEVRVYSLPGGELRLRVAGREVTQHKALSHDGRYAAVAETGGAVRVFDLATAGEVFRWVRDDAGPVRQLAFTREGGLLAMPEGGGPVRVLNLPAVRAELTARGLGW